MNLEPTLESLVLAGAALTLCGCASIVSSGDRRVEVNSTPAAATVTV